MLQTGAMCFYCQRKQIKFQKKRFVYLPDYLDVKLEVALVHLSGHHTLNDLHRHKLVAIKGRTEDVVGFTLLNL